MKAQVWGRLAGALAMALVVAAVPLPMTPQGGDTLLKAADAEKLLPDKVYYKAQSAPSQLRNSGGIKFSDGYYLLATLVDTSGYSSDVQAKYQAYFITEVPIKIGGHDLPAGVYGVGFIPDNKFIVTDIGAHDLFGVSSTTDDQIKRPMPLQVLVNSGGGFRFYEGRKYVVITR